jgi:hypothetical protein
VDGFREGDHVTVNLDGASEQAGHVTVVFPDDHVAVCLWGMPNSLVVSNERVTLTYRPA